MNVYVEVNQVASAISPSAAERGRILSELCRIWVDLERFMTEGAPMPDDAMEAIADRQSELSVEILEILDSEKDALSKLRVAAAAIETCGDSDFTKTVLHSALRDLEAA